MKWPLEKKETAESLKERDEIFSTFLDNTAIENGETNIDQKTRIYIEEIILPEMKYLKKKSSKSKRLYYWLTITVIIIGALISIVTALSALDLLYKIPLSILGAASTAINTLLSLLNPKEQWLENRAAKERLYQILTDYFMETGQFSEVKGNGEEKQQLLCDLYRDEMSNVVKTWKLRVKKSDSGKQGGTGT